MDRRYIRHALPVNKFDESTNASASALATTFRHTDTLLQAMRFFLSWFDRVFVERTREEKNRRFLNRSFPLLFANLRLLPRFSKILRRNWRKVKSAKWTEKCRLSRMLGYICCTPFPFDDSATAVRPPLRTRQRQSAQPESFNTLRDRLSAKA